MVSRLLLVKMAPFSGVLQCAAQDENTTEFGPKQTVTLLSLTWRAEHCYLSAYSFCQALVTRDRILDSNLYHLEPFSSEVPVELTTALEDDSSLVFYKSHQERQDGLSLLQSLRMN